LKSILTPPSKAEQEVEDAIKQNRRKASTKENK
jgi:hypothetical protein